MIGLTTSTHIPAPLRRNRLKDLRKGISLDSFVVWAYRDQKVEKMTNAALEPIERVIAECELRGKTAEYYMGSGTVDSSVRIERIAAVGTEIDGGGKSFACHPDAESLHEIVGTMRPLERMLIQRFGNSGDAPEWHTQQPHPVPVPVEDDKPGRYRHKVSLASYEVEGHRPRIGRGEKGKLTQLGEFLWLLELDFCPITYYPPAAYVTSVRDEYTAWHHAMSALSERLRTVRFQDYRVTGVEAHPAPWTR